MTTVAVLGAGSWGTVLAAVLAASGCRVRLWMRSPEAADRLRAEQGNAADTTLPGDRQCQDQGGGADSGPGKKPRPAAPLPASVTPTANLAEALEDADLVLFVLPTTAIREVADRAATIFPADAPAISCAKGFEGSTGLRMTEVLVSAVPALRGRVAALSGPNLAGEIAEGRPAAAVIAAAGPELARTIQVALNNPRLRLYTSHDVIGVEYGGALKNCIAIAAGVADGLEMGVNARSALITRGLAEIARLGVAAGAQALTFAGLAGLGDLIATCSSPRSRNYQVGLHLAAGRQWPEIGKLLGHVAEGVGTTTVARGLAARYGVRTPIIDSTYEVLYRQRPVQEALTELLAGPPGDELADLRPDAP